MSCHHLKTWPEYFEAVELGDKTFEIRENDRGFKVGDLLLLREWNPASEQYSGKELLARVTYLTSWEQKEGFVVLAIQLERTYRPESDWGELIKECRQRWKYASPLRKGIVAGERGWPKSSNPYYNPATRALFDQGHEWGRRKS